MDIEENVGVSTLFMPDSGEGLEKSLNLAREAGIQTLEIVPTNFQGNTGYPRTKLSVGFNLDEFSSKEIAHLQKKVSLFSHVTVHAPHLDLNIASHNPGIRRESQRQYLSCIKLAKEIGAELVTFHPGLSNPEEIIGDEEFIKKCNIEFGLKICDSLEKDNIVSGYEIVGGMKFQLLKEIIERINNPSFGLLLDIGHCYLLPDADPLQIIENFHKKIVEIHLHGTYHRPDRGFENHQPLHMDDCTDFPELFKLLKEKGFSSPIVLEILAFSIKQYLELSRQAKQKIREWWKKGKST